MKLKIISSSVSKKGKRYLSVEIVEGETPPTGVVVETVEEEVAEEE